MAAIRLRDLLKEVDVDPEKLDESISDDHLHEIALFLTSWRRVVTYLGVEENDMDAIEQNEKDDLLKKIRAFQKWKGKFGFKATYGMLVEVLLRLAMADVAEKVLYILKGVYVTHVCYTCTSAQWRRNRNTIGGAGVRGCEAADYPPKVPACEGQKLERNTPPPRFRRS